MKMRCWRLKTEAKVGAITIIGMALLAYMVIFLGGYSFHEKGYEINIIFDQVNGLKPGNVVRYAGMEVGKVVDIESNNGIITVHTKIRPHVKMFEESYVSIGSDGLMGERYITITPQVNAKNILAPGATIKGQAQQGMEELVSNANSAIKDFQKLINSLNEIFSNQNLKTSVIESAINIRKITENITLNPKPQTLAAPCPSPTIKFFFGFYWPSPFSITAGTTMSFSFCRYFSFTPPASSVLLQLPKGRPIGLALTIPAIFSPPRPKPRRWKPWVILLWARYCSFSVTGFTTTGCLTAKIRLTTMRCSMPLFSKKRV